MPIPRQQNLLEVRSQGQVVNVASVPQRSPFRYPGGKTWLVPQIRYWISSLGPRPKLFIEPFAGGGIVSLTVAAEKLADHILMVEIDNQVAAVWQTILSGEARWLAERIANFDLTAENAEDVLAYPPDSLREQAFQTILKNRIFHGGILAPGSGMLKKGENGKGIKSRWYPKTLQRRILAIEAIRERITFIEGDGITGIREYACHPDAVFFIDPPYTAAGKRAGKRLYTHNDLDHEILFDVAKSIAGDFLMTYDDAEEVRAMACKRDFDTQVVAMKNTHHAVMNELLIGRNLDWAR
jgi:DNA adenine methylase